MAIFKALWAYSRLGFQKKKKEIPRLW